MSASATLRLVVRVVGIWLALNLTPAYAAPKKKIKKPKPHAVAARSTTINYYTINRAPEPRLALAAPPPPSASLSSAATAPTEDIVKRILNFRIHPVYLIQTMAQKDMVAAARGDLDFVLGDRFTLGPSLIFQKTSTQDVLALQNGMGQTIDDTRFDVGLLANIYLTGTTSTGGFILRPHFYWIDVSSQKDQGNGATVTPTSSQNGIRAGGELIYQKILGNGFNFEVGGGFTYYLVPYQINYNNDVGLQTDQPASRFVPTISLAIGWAF